MIKEWKLVFLGILIIIFASGCAFATYQTPIYYNYVDDGEIDAALSNMQISVEEFIDSRNDVDPRTIIHLKNGYGQTTTGGYKAQKPLTQI